MRNETLNRPVFLIEDNPVDLDLTLRAFRKKKLSNPIVVARDGAEAMELVDNWDKNATKPVVILLDLKLPKVDGLEVLKHIKSLPGFSRVPVVILTSSSADKDMETAYDLGANSYIIKPVDFEKFLAVTEQIEIYWNIINEPY